MTTLNLNNKPQITKTIEEKIQDLINKGCKLSVEEITAIIEKQEAKKAKSDKKSAKRWNAREEAANIKVTGNCFHNIEEANRQTSLNCRPSSMR